MISKRKNLYLYLGLACFVVIVGIFVDGYMGVYDTVRMTTRWREREIELGREFDYRWHIHLEDRIERLLRFDREFDCRRHRRAWPVWEARWGEKVLFSYEVDNRRFSNYVADIEVSIRFINESPGNLTLISQRMSIGAFRKGRIEWVVDTIELFPTPPRPKQEYLATIKIERGEIERKVHLHIYR